MIDLNDLNGEQKLSLLRFVIVAWLVLIALGIVLTIALMEQGIDQEQSIAWGASLVLLPLIVGGIIAFYNFVKDNI